MPITHSTLLKIVHYNEHTGEFTWASPRPKIIVGQRAGTIHTKGHRKIKVAGKLYFEHRLAWFYVYKTWPDGIIDHINGDPGDNRIANLRIATNGQNRANSKTYAASGYKGVTFKKWLKDKPWQAAITHNKRVIYLGCFPTKEEAHKAYCDKAKELHGEFFRP